MILLVFQIFPIKAAKILSGNDACIATIKICGKKMVYHIFIFNFIYVPTNQWNGNIINEFSIYTIVSMYKFGIYIIYIYHTFIYTNRRALGKFIFGMSFTSNLKKGIALHVIAVHSIGRNVNMVIINYNLIDFSQHKSFILRELYILIISYDAIETYGIQNMIYFHLCNIPFCGFLFAPNQYCDNENE